MIKLFELLSELFLKEVKSTTHYEERKAERKKIIRISLPKEAYEGYNLNEVEKKLIPFLENQLIENLKVVEAKSFSENFNIGYRVLIPMLKNKEKIYPINVTVESKVGSSNVKKQITGNTYVCVIKDEELITLLLTPDPSEETIKRQMEEHDIRNNTVNNKQYIVFGLDPKTEPPIDIDELFEKNTPPAKQATISKENLSYKIKADYRTGSKFFIIRSQGTLLKTPIEGTIIKGGSPDANGVVHDAQVKFGNYVKSYSSLYTNSYFNRYDTTM